jgi:serine/threonine-protein kinase
MLTTRGQAKVLDFGLAEYVSEPLGMALAVGGASQFSATAENARGRQSNAGMVMGTAAYMSPEQARGTPVDKRTDIWAFGCVLYEMLTGRQTFRGETSADTIAAIVGRDPDWNGLPPTVPAQVCHLLRRCLQKDVGRRLRDIGDARLEMEEALASPATPELTIDKAPRVPSRWRSGIRLGGAFLVGVAVIGVALWTSKVFSPPKSQPVSRVVVALPPDTRLSLDPPSLVLSPDGTKLVYGAVRGGTSQLYLRPLDQMEARPIPGSEGGGLPFFSPSGEWLGYFADAKLKRWPLTGGPPVVLCNAPGGRGGTWGENGTIVFAPVSRGGLYMISSEGGRRGFWPLRTPAKAKRATAGRTSCRAARSSCLLSWVPVAPTGTS